MHTDTECFAPKPASGLVEEEVEPFMKYLCPSVFIGGWFVFNSQIRVHTWCFVNAPKLARASSHAPACADFGSKVRTSQEARTTARRSARDFSSPQARA